MKYAWISIIDKSGENIGVMLVEAEDIMIIDFCEHDLENDPQAKADTKNMPKNRFLMKDEMAKYAKLFRIDV